jgi:hypothetical protein
MRRKQEEDFMMQYLGAGGRSEAETVLHSRSQIVTLKRGGNLDYFPFTFTEHGRAFKGLLTWAKAARNSYLYVGAVSSGPKAWYHTSPAHRAGLRGSRQIKGLKARFMRMERAFSPQEPYRHFVPGPMAQTGMNRAVGAEESRPTGLSEKFLIPISC